MSSLSRSLRFPSLSRAFFTVSTSQSLSSSGDVVSAADRKSNAGRESDTLGRRLMSLVFNKRSAAVVLRKWAEEGKHVDKYQLTNIAHELRKCKRYKHALEICEWMRIQPQIKLLSSDYALHLDLISKFHGLASAEKFFEGLPKKMKDKSTSAALLHAFVQNKMSDRAESLMEEMARNGFLGHSLPFNHMLSLYISNDEMHKIPNLMKEMKKYTSPDLVTYNLWLNAFMKKNDVVSAEKVCLKMQEEKIGADWVTYSTIAHIYIKADCYEKAKAALDKMEKTISKKERVAYCSLLSLYANILDKENVHRIWNKMKSTFRKLSDDEFRCMLSSLTKLGDIKEAEDIYCEWESISTTRDSRLPNVLLAFYVNNDMTEKTASFYNHMVKTGVKPSYTTWELLALGFLNMNKMDEVLSCLHKAFSSLKKWNPNSELVKRVFCKIESSGDIESAEKFLVSLRAAGYVTTEIYNSLLRAYAKAGKMPLIVAERMKQDEVSMNEETKELLRLTSKFCVGDVSTLIS